MKDFSVVMALVDFIPVVLFAVAAIMLQRDLYNKMSKGAFSLFAAGTIDAIFAGSSKALYKLLYAAGICDFQPLNSLYFPVISVGFLLAGLGLVGMLTHKQSEKAEGIISDKAAFGLVAPVAYNGTVIMICFMVSGLAMIYIVLGVLARRLKKPVVIAVLAFSYICALCMGYLASKDFTEAIWNWIAQVINILGQGTLLLSVIVMRKAGLTKLELKRR